MVKSLTDRPSGHCCVQRHVQRSAKPLATTVEPFTHWLRVLSCFLGPLGIVEACEISRILPPLKRRCTHFTSGDSIDPSQPPVTISSTIWYNHCQLFAFNCFVVTCTASLLPTKQSQLTSLLYLLNTVSSAFCQLIDDTDFHARFIWEWLLLFPKKSQINQRWLLYFLCFQSGNQSHFSWIVSESPGCIVIKNGK